MNLDTMTPPPINEDGVIDSREGRTALIVDDRPEFLSLIAPWLTSLGYLILTAADGKEAQGMMMQKGVANFDLLITDLDMPRMQGDELARWFVRENSGARVLLMSGCLGETKLPEGVVCLEKPFSREVFMARVGDLLGPAQRPGNVSAFEHTSL